MREFRQKIWDDYKGDKPSHMAHPWLHYTRYPYADQIIASLRNLQVDFSHFVVMDYGCGVGDYGFQFGRQGAEVIFFDNETYINFIKFRLEQDESKFKAHLVPIAQEHILYEIPFPDLVIFGEVLEHLVDPLKILTNFIEKQVKYIFTSSYPYRSDDPKNSYWNHRGHAPHSQTREQQPACRQLLETYYQRVKYNGEASLWIRK